MPFSTIGKHRLGYRLKLDGPESFVFIHGLGASRNSFDRCFGMEALKGYTWLPWTFLVVAKAAGRMTFHTP